MLQTLAGPTGISDDLSFLRSCPPMVAALHDLWDRRRAGRRMPRRGDFDPIDLKTWMGRTILFDRLPGAMADGEDFLYRLIGVGLVGEVGRDLTGLRVSTAAVAADPSATLINLRAIAANRSPRYRDDLVLCADGVSFLGERIFLPMSEDGEAVNIILCFVCPARRLDGSRSPSRKASFWNMIGR